MKPIILSIALLYTASSFGAECGNLLVMSKKDFVKKLHQHIDTNIQPELLNIEADSMDIQLSKSIQFSKCVDLRVLKELPPESLKRRTAILSLYGNGLDTFNTHPRLAASEKKILNQAIEENIRFFKPLSSSSFFKKDREKLIFFGIEHIQGNKYYIEEIRKSNNRLVKYSDTFAKRQLKQFINSSLASMQMKKYISKITDISIKKNMQSKEQKFELETYDWNGYYEIDKLKSFTYMHDQDDNRVELYKYSLIKIIKRRGNDLYLVISNRENEGVFSIEKSKILRYATKLQSN